jgi:putative Mg2+ transporter-C (MgtC) family protein
VTIEINPTGGIDPPHRKAGTDDELVNSSSGTVESMTAHVSDLGLAAAHGQTWTQVGELLLAFVLSAGIGLERQVRGKSAGLRTQAIVGTTSALILLISKYGFADVLADGLVVLDPSRVAAQIVSGIGFLGAGLIITRQGAIRGLTTAAAVWETAAIGMAAGAGLPLLALVVTALHFVIVLGFTWLTAHLPGATHSRRLHVSYRDRQGVLRDLLAACTRKGWTVSGMATDAPGPAGALERFVARDVDEDQRLVSVVLSLTGRAVTDAVSVLAGVDGVVRISAMDEETE